METMTLTPVHSRGYAVQTPDALTFRRMKVGPSRPLRGQAGGCRRDENGEKPVQFTCLPRRAFVGKIGMLLATFETALCEWVDPGHFRGRTARVARTRWESSAKVCLAYGSTCFPRPRGYPPAWTFPSGLWVHFACRFLPLLALVRRLSQWFESPWRQTAQRCIASEGGLWLIYCSCRRSPLRGSGGRGCPLPWAETDRGSI